MYGVRMTPAHLWYVGRGDDTCGGEVVYSIQDIRQLLSVQPERCETVAYHKSNAMGSHARAPGLPVHGHGVL
jgi:hypothetical protein